MTKWLIDGTTEIPSLFERIKEIFRPQPRYFMLEFDDKEQSIIMHAGLLTVISMEGSFAFREEP